MNLASLLFMLEQQLMRCESAFKEALLMTSQKEKLKRRHHLEGALSDAWQAYCCFVRLVAINSSIGCITATGSTHSSSIVPANWQRASYLAICVSKKKPPIAGKINSLIRNEPTWGDSSKISDIVSILNPGNGSTLVGHFAGGFNGPKHCQIVRNACAHTNHQTKKDVVALASSYVVGKKFSHPSDAMLWLDPSVNQFAFVSWLDDMRTIAAGAVS